MSISTFVTLSHAEDVALTADKSTILEQKKKSIEAGAEVQRYEWLSPLNLSASHTQQYSDKTNTRSGLSQLSASFSQNLFRSGGIYYTIKYANDKYNYDALSLEQQHKNYQKEIILSALRIKKYELQLKQSEYLVENKKITLFLKQTQYELGDIDITLLNDALMEKNTEQTNYVLLQETLANEQLELQKYTEAAVDSISLPTFSLIDEETYTKNNYNIAMAKQQNSVTYDSYRKGMAEYLPSLKLNAQATYTSYDSGAVVLNQNGTLYSAGLVLNIPLDYNTFAAKEEMYTSFLEQKAQTNDTQREELLEYKKTLLSIKRYQDVNKILQENLELYTKLKKITQKAFETGYKTGYDVQILENSINSAKLEIEINKINIQLSLATLHFALRDTKEQL
ncbi:TolC family protein [Sulfurimonas marina]|uniref:TolC family protein n=1 Tax=Sulfurimonas marina TaxID=2590551 RepID=A0A7M1AXI4_9BACT|nr:TolC family protein [Sulfurimonas marina]QOP42169.1 TolC family protein [Sulfurimonas marina]